MEQNRAVPAILEAIRVIRAHDDRSPHYRNQVNLLYSAMSDDHADAFDHWEGLIEDMILALQEAEEQRRILLQHMADYLASLQAKMSQ